MAEQTAPAGAVVDGPTDHIDGISLLEDEVVLATGHPNWANWRTPVVLAVVLGLAALVTISMRALGAFVGEFVLAGMFVAYVYLARSSSRYIVTNRLVKKRVGLPLTTTAEARLSDITALATRQGVIDGILDTGSVTIDSAGEDGFIGIRGVSDHEELADLIREQQHTARRDAELVK